MDEDKMDTTNASSAKKNSKVVIDPWIRLPNESRFRQSLIGGIKNIESSVYLSGLNGNLLTKVECDSVDDAVALIMEVNEQLDAIG